MNNDRAVNPVVGTILMVGIVVILSAAIGTFVIGLGTDLDSGAQSAVDISSVSKAGENGSVTVSVIDLGSADHVTISVTANTGNKLRDVSGDTVSEREIDLEEVGDPATFEEGNATGGPADTTIEIVGIAVNGGSEQVIMNREETV